ncbi:MAG: hypothetical protein DRQ60_04670 [Gammaproteobacteria bacterium]|nr:MAG: hypothetical protein DRQ60_04670 [Gammaproteobacteria bacterium]
MFKQPENSQSANEVIKKEKEFIEKNRRQGPKKPWIGLALSGGGIRSASFGLGVLQGLQKNESLDQVDYLSTVSGGGYIGSSLTWFYSGQPTAESPAKKSLFPFGARGKGARSESAAGGTMLDYIRQHGNYLTPTGSMGLMSLLATVLRSTLLSVSVYFALTVVVLALFIESALLVEPGSCNGILNLSGSADCGSATEVVVWLGVGFALISVLYGLGTYVASASGGGGDRSMGFDYGARTFFQRLLGWLLTLVVALFVVGSIPFADAWLKETMGSLGTFATGTSAAATGGAGAIYQAIRRQGASAFKRAPSAIRIQLTAFLLIYGLLLLAYLGAGELLDFSWSTVRHLDLAWADNDLLGVPAAIYGLLLLGVAAGFLVNVNLFSLCRMYRDRLMEAFLPDDAAVESGRWQRASGANSAKLKEMCGAAARGPYQLINSNLVLVDSLEAKFRGRGGDNFLLSPQYCGSDATGWYGTDEFMNGRLTLATAMAISGAAANPNAGVAGEGPTRNRLVSFLMSFLNLRLGYWVENPAASRWRQRLTRVVRPNFLFPGLLQGILGKRQREDAAYVELTDGGHFENLGLYELARRQLDYIIISDAGADPDFSMGDLGNAIERIRVDFGFTIRFSEGEHDLGQILPGSAGNEPYDLKYQLAKRGFAIGTITYDPGEEEGQDVREPREGTIIYLKATATRNLPGDIYAYQASHKEFPHQPTSDQFFDERQLESYRELGYQICDDMLTYTLMKSNREKRPISPFFGL